MTTTQTPFLDVNSFSAEELQEPAPLVRSATPTSSPFLSVYELNDGEVPQNDPVREAYALLMNEIHDEEFDEALFELQCHGRAMHDEQLAMGKPRAEADRLVAQHFSQLIHASDAMVDSMAREFVPREQAGIVDHEIDAFVEGYTPTENLDPEFENIFGGILRKVGRGLKAAAGTAWQGIKKYGIQPFLNLMKKALRELVKSALTMATNKIPVQFRPAAQLLAQKLGFSQAPPAPTSTDSAGSTGAAPSAPPDSAGSPVQAAAGDDAASPQQELNEHIAAALLVQDEVELELEAARFSSPSGMAARPVFADLEDARARFIHELESLGPDESAAPHIQNFLPAVIKAVQVGVSLIGKEKVVNVLAQPLAALIKKSGTGPGAVSGNRRCGPRASSSQYTGDVRGRDGTACACGGGRDDRRDDQPGGVTA